MNAATKYLPQMEEKSTILKMQRIVHLKEAIQLFNNHLKLMTARVQLTFDLQFTYVKPTFLCTKLVNNLGFQS